MAPKVKFGALIALLLWANVHLALLSHGNPIPLRQDFAHFPVAVGAWSGIESGKLSTGEENVLKADDYLWRLYQRDGRQIGLFIAYYKSQKSGDTMHSPRNCLPGNGWEVTKSDVIRIPSHNPAYATFPANRLLLTKDGAQQEIIYWYQANSRVFASEYSGKLYLVKDALQKNRTDGAIVRVSAVAGPGSHGASRNLIEFASELSGVLPEFLPN